MDLHNVFMMAREYVLSETAISSKEQGNVSTNSKVAVVEQCLQIW